jgi:hypothetical protein
VLGIALLGAVVTSSFTAGFQTRLVETGFREPTAARIVATAGSEAASGGGTAQQFLQQAPPGATLEQAESMLAAVKESFVHSLHVGMLVAVGFLILASVVSFLFVRSHVGAGSHAGDGA